MSERQFHLFLSSPSDVRPERDRAKIVIDRLNGEFQGVARIEILRWEDGFYSAAHSFQEAIDQAVARMSGTDMVVCIVWSRVGLKLNPAVWRRPNATAYESGTVLEFETAVEVSRQHNGAPDVYLFRKTADVLYHADRFAEEKEQHELLDAVWRRWTQTTEGYNTAGYQRFHDTDEFEQQFESCIRQWLARRGVAVGGAIWERDLKGSPFCGLAPFEASHASVFFGREAAIEKSIAKLKRSRFLLLIGSSGSGKSSLLRAGLIPRVTRPGIIPEVDVWRCAIVLPGADPLVSLAEALCTDGAIGRELREVDFGTPQLFLRLLEAGSETAQAPIRGALDRIAQRRAVELHYDAPRPACLLIAVDQVERLFVEADTLRTEAFAALLRALVERGLAHVMVVLRSDAYGRFQKTESFVALREGGATHDLLPPTSHELEDIVTRPVAACRPPLAFEIDAAGRSLAEVLVAEAQGGDALPLLQMTLQRLYEAEGQRDLERNRSTHPTDDLSERISLLRFADYPGMGAAVTRAAEEAFAMLPPAARAALPALITAFVRDVDVAAERGEGALTIVPVERATFEHGRRERSELVQAFVAHRLLTAEESAGIVRVRPVHEALLRVWPEAVRIIADNAALIRVRRTLEPMVADWSGAAAQAKGGYLVTSPALLAGAAQLAERMGDDLDAPMRAFVAGSLQADATRRDAERSRQRKALVATAAGLMVAIVLAALAAWQWRAADAAGTTARLQRDRAERAIEAAIATANALVNDQARTFRDRVGMPNDLVRDILDRSQKLRDQLLKFGEISPDLLHSAALGDNEVLLTMLQQSTSKAQADVAALLSIALRFQATMSELVAKNPDNAEWQYTLSLSHNRLGDVLVLAARYQDALEQYSESQAIRERLLAADPANARWQGALATAFAKTGDMQRPLGRYEEALAAYDKSLAIRQRLADLDPSDADRQRELSVSHESRGLALTALGRREEALAEFTKTLEIRQRLTTDQSNAQWRRDLSISYERLGDSLNAVGQLAPALAAFRESIAIRQALAEADPNNTTRQRDLAVSHGRIGNTQLALGRREEGLDALRKSLAIREVLARDDPANVLWQTDLVIALRSLALAGDEARPRLARALEIARTLRDQGRLGADQVGWPEALERELAKLPQ